MIKNIVLSYMFLVFSVELYSSDRKWIATPGAINYFIGGKEYIFCSDGVKEVINEALRAGTPEALQECLEGKDVTQMRDFNDSPLLAAIIDNKPYAIPILLKAGIPNDLLNERNKTFLDIAKECGYQEVVEQLLEAEEQKNQPVMCESPTRMSPSRFSPLTLFSSFLSKNK